jgi:very-short-patch-repair endonuclease
MREERIEPGPDALVARIAGRQHGVISLTQLNAAGIDRNGVTRRVRRKRLHRLHRGVYAVGHSGLSREGRWMAAVLACGAGAVLSHRSAAELWEMLKPSGGPVHVTVPVAGGRRHRAGIRIHRVPLLPPGATTFRGGIAVTTPARTMADLCGTIPAWELRRAIRQADFVGLPIGDEATESDKTRSDLERRFLRLCRRYGLPKPEVNVRVGRFTVDFLWREQRLIVETDAYVSHRGRQAFEDDRARDNDMMGMGFDVLRFTDVRIVKEPERVAALVRGKLNHPPR